MQHPTDLDKLDYLSLQNITFGYTLPRLLEKITEKLRVFGVADNVALFGPALRSTPSYTIAYSGSLYAPIRSISGGLNITF